ncbi:MAG: sulfur oxidation protein SoxYZ [Sulfurovum sp. FS06-10]|jgi:sulfur-oxidizing protein SoxY|nr:MAG: sulfur oxidation protein SoxYZ [Sulfurovum sp. FS06-10]
MDRRKFLGLGLAAVAVLPATALNATDFRKEKPDAWTAHKVDEAIKAVYGETVPTDSKDITLKVPKVASNGGAIPVTIQTEMKAKSVGIFQDANPESAVAVFTVPEGGMVDYTIKMKMKGSGAITVIVEGTDGKLYSTTKSLEVALGGCEG